MLGRLEAAARRDKPDVFVAIDFPDFNFRLLPKMRALGIPVVYYISPQLWAWRHGRLDTIKRYVDRMLVIFPFEAAIYDDAGVPVEFIGHPLIDLIPAPQPRDTFLRAASIDPAKPVVALLPGSRPSELNHILPTMAESLSAIRTSVPEVQFLVARAPGLDDRHFAPLDPLRASGIPISIVENATDDVLESADVVITASGTATVQTALHERPMAIVYRLSPLTYAIGKRFVQVSTYGMVNLIAGKTIVPELIQDNFTPARVAAEAVSLLTEPARVEIMKAALREVQVKLGGGGAQSARAARAIVGVASRRGAQP